MVYAQLQPNLLRRNGLRFDQQETGAERFVWIVQDPESEQQLALVFSLARLDGRLTGFASLHRWLDTQSQGEMVSIRGENDRVRIDPERLGVGIEQCHWGDQSSSGYLASPSSVYTWYIETAGFDTKPQEISNGLGWPLIRSSSTVLRPYSSTIVEGELEIWHGHGRHVDRERINLGGWLVTQLRSYGTFDEDFYWLVMRDGKGHVMTIHQSASYMGPWLRFQQVFTQAELSRGVHHIERQFGAWHAKQLQQPFQPSWLHEADLGSKKIFSGFELRFVDLSPERQPLQLKTDMATLLRPCWSQSPKSTSSQQLGLLGKWSKFSRR